MRAHNYTKYRKIIRGMLKFIRIVFFTQVIFLILYLTLYTFRRNLVVNQTPLVFDFLFDLFLFNKTKIELN